MCMVGYEDIKKSPKLGKIKLLRHACKNNLQNQDFLSDQICMILYVPFLHVGRTKLKGLLVLTWQVHCVTEGHSSSNCLQTGFKLHTFIAELEGSKHSAMALGAQQHAKCQLLRTEVVPVLEWHGV